jgi:hypothetical protein
MGLALATATSLFLLCVLVPTMAGSPLADASPYSDERPKRVYIQHISRAYFDDKIAPVGEKFDLLTSPAAHHRDHGAWANAMDYLNMEPLAKVDMGLGAASASSDPCDSVPSRLQRSLLCDMPWYARKKEWSERRTPIPYDSTVWCRAGSMVCSRDECSVCVVWCVVNGPCMYIAFT